MFVVVLLTVLGSIVWLYQYEPRFKHSVDDFASVYGKKLIQWVKDRVK